MDDSRFDDLTRLLGAAGGRRAVSGALLGTVLGSTATEGVARKRDEGSGQPGQTGTWKPSAAARAGTASGARRSGATATAARRRSLSPAIAAAPSRAPTLNRGAPRADCDFAGQSFVGGDLNGSTFRGIDGRGATFNGTDNHGSTFAAACLQGARFRQANLTGSTWGGACLFDADFTGADLGEATTFNDARFCGTVMPDGSVNDRDCERGTACCQRRLGGDSCQSVADCLTFPCYATSCTNGQCELTQVVTGPSPNDLCSFCCENSCCQGNANQCNPGGLCCAPNCAERVCGPDGCGGTGTCGDCADGLACNDQGRCVCTPQSCAAGCCDGEGNCRPGDTNQACGTGGATCESCGAGQTCQNQHCAACEPDCAGKTCGPDGCGGSCGSCAEGQRCQNGQCVCDAESCPDGCCASGPGNPGACRSGTNRQTCGAGGAQCATCPQGQDCLGQQCAVCNPQTCSDGCCAADGTCQSGYAIHACGGPAGAPCASCSDQQTCQNRQCADCGQECICTGQSICADPDAPNITCPGPSPSELCICYVSSAGRPLCGGGIVQLPAPGCTSDAECQQYAAGSVCVDSVNVPGQPQCAGVPFCVTPCCTPDCAGKVCGFDGCGGACGTCGPCQRCEGGTCQVLQPNGAPCSQDSACCSGNCFADVCADRVTNCGRNVCNPPAKGCLDDLCCSCASVAQCCAGGCCGDGQVCDGGECVPG